ncbi:MAG: hypothetical protein HGB29_10465, partial [Chlorobiaceae bacterium]|nr:hypothetical protein [Chlorobiaceae bacterium]
KSRLYGESNPMFAQSITGYVSGEDATSAGVAGVAEGSSAAMATSRVGSYLISGSTGTLSAGNYDFTAVDLPGGLTIDPAPLTITPADVTKPFGIAVELREYTLTGLRNGETVGSVTLGSAGADASAPVEGSPYDIVAANAAGGSFDAGNYRIVYNTGLLTVLPIPNPVLDDPPVDSSMLVALAQTFVSPGDVYGLGTHGLISVDLLVPATADNQGTIVVTLPGSQLLRDASFRFSLPQEVSESLQAGSEAVTLSDGRPLPGWLAYRHPRKVFEGWNVHREALPLSVTISSDERSWEVIITEEKLHGPM